MTHTLERSHDEVSIRRRRRKGSRLRTMLFVALLVSLGLVATGVLPVQHYLEAEQNVAAAREALATVEEENAALAEDAEALLTDQEIERLAREQYGYVLPGEVGYVVVTPEEPVVETGTPHPVVSQEGDTAKPGFFGRIWAFITGADLAEDG